MTILYARHGMTTGFFTAQYRRVLDFAADMAFTPPDLSTQVADNSRVKKLVNSGIWDNEDILYFLGRGSSEFSRINYKDPENYYITLIGTPNWNSSGFAGSSGNGLNTNWRPIDGVNYQEFVNSVTHRSVTSSASSNYDWGLLDQSATTGVALKSRLGNNTARGFDNTSVETGLTTVTDAAGLFIYGRSGNGSNNFLWQNGVELLSPGSIGSNTVGRSTLKMYLCGINFNGGFATGSGRRFDYFAVGGPKTMSQKANYHIYIQ